MPLPKSGLTITKNLPTKMFTWLLVIVTAVSSGTGIYLYAQNTRLNRDKNSLENSVKDTGQKLSQSQSDLNSLKNQDQYKVNRDLSARIKNIESAYSLVVSQYENLQDLKQTDKNTGTFDILFAEILSELSKLNYFTASAEIASLSAQLKAEQDKIIAQSQPSFTAAASLPASNTPPANGYSRQMVHTSAGDFMIDIVAGNLSSTRVAIDTATDGDCSNNCPVMPLSSYIARSGAYAGVNGSYFCPATYPSCAGKTNSFDTLVMNKNHHYINSANNVYSTVPVVAFYGTTARFMGQSLEWGRDTGVDAVIANHPLLVQDGKIVASDGGDPKLVNKSNRSFVAATGSTAYIGVVYNVTVGQSALVLQSLGIANALNLDSGGSTAFWYNGYRAGPGRDLPNVVLFLRR